MYFSLGRHIKWIYGGMSMRKIINIIVTLLVMVVVSLICLLVVSAFSYFYKWQADKALVGITITYIFAGFIGGITQKFLDKSERNMGKKMLEAILISSIFIGMILGISAIVLQQPLMISSRFLSIYMLLAGSTCMGRIL